MSLTHGATTALSQWSNLVFIYEFWVKTQFKPAAVKLFSHVLHRMHWIKYQGKSAAIISQAALLHQRKKSVQFGSDWITVNDNVANTELKIKMQMAARMRKH